jgi:hypothetical protein
VLTIWDSTPVESVPVDPESGDSSIGPSAEMVPHVSVIPYPCMHAR